MADQLSSIVLPSSCLFLHIQKKNSFLILHIVSLASEFAYIIMVII